MDRVSNKTARDWVNRGIEFQGNNTFAKWITTNNNKLYVVYSYGSHFPMYIYDQSQDRWVGNNSKYSQTTSKHQSQLKPSDTINRWLNTNEMQAVIHEGGLLGYVINQART